MSATPATIAAPLGRRRASTFPRRAVVIVVLSVVTAMILSYVGSNVWTSLQQQDLRDRFDTAAALWSALDPVERSAIGYAPGDPIARLEIPSIGLDAVVVEGATPALMRSAPGHLPSSATPGDNGVAMITANRMGFGGFFLRIDRLAPGDRIVGTSAFGRVVYEVESVSVVPADRMDLSTASSERVLLLFASGRLWGGADRLIVRAVARGM